MAKQPAWRNPRTINVAIIGVMMVVLVEILWRLIAPISTPPFRDKDGGAIAGSIAVVERWPVNGVTQTVVIRGRNQANPLLVWLHGDGLCETPDLRLYNSVLEDHFTVVYWCQRHAGQSFDPFAAPPKTLTIDQYVADLEVVVDLVRARFHQDKVVLVGHSWGTVLGVLYTERHPEKVAAYLGVSQVVNSLESERRSYAYVLAVAQARKDAKLVDRIRKLGPPPRPDGTIYTPRAWLQATGGLFHADMSNRTLALMAARSSEANWRDVAGFLGGAEKDFAPVLPEVRGLTLDIGHTEFAAPVFFLSGRYDHTTDAALAHSYFERVVAPRKEFVWFDQSAHSPPFEEPARFNDWIITHVRPLATGPSR